MLAELHNQKKHIILCKVHTHIRIKGNEVADKSAKQAIDIPEMISKDYLTQTDY